LRKPEERLYVSHSFFTMRPGGYNVRLQRKGKVIPNFSDLVETWRVGSSHQE